jgi:hypothetical protein
MNATARDPLVPVMIKNETRSWPKYEIGKRVRYYRLSEALTTRWRGDEHTAAYSAPQIERRLCTDPPAYLRTSIEMVVFLWDVDCAAAHRAMGGAATAKADDAWWSAALAKIRRLFRAHPGGFAYRTRGGARIVYRLPEPFALTRPEHESEWKRRYLHSLAYLAREFDIVCDPSISDWPRLFRLPHTVRDGKPQDLETVGDARHIGAFDYLPDDRQHERNIETARHLAEQSNVWRPALRILAQNDPPVVRIRRAPRVVEPREIDAGEFTTLAEDLGKELRHLSGRHQIHLALAGAVYGRGFPLERGPELARAICAVTGETDDRPQVWQTTADRFADRAIVGYSTLKQHWPRLAAIVDAAMPPDGGAKSVRDALDAIGVPAEVPALEAAPLVRAAIENAKPGLQVLRATEGAGKTQATGDAVVARALAITTERIKAHQRTLFVTASHDVARVIVDKLDAAGITAEYWRSVLAVKLPDGTPACDYHVPLARLVNGGHSAIATFCEGFGMGHEGTDAPCPRRDHCPAFADAIVQLHPIADRSTRVVVTVHAKLAEGLEWAGDDALVVIDEDHETVTPHNLTRAQIEAAAGTEGFSSREAYRSVVLRAVAAGLERGPLPTVDALQTIFARGCEALREDDGWWRDANDMFGTDEPESIARQFAARVAYRRKPVGEHLVQYFRRTAWAPRPSPRERSRVFTGQADTAFAEASRIHALIGRLFAGIYRVYPDGAPPHFERAVAFVEAHDTDPSRRILRALIASPAMGEACRRSGPTVLLDATADLEVLGAIAGRAIPCTEVRVADGAPVHRRLLYWSAASRRGVFAQDIVRWDNGLARYLTEAVRYVLEHLSGDAPSVAIFSWMKLADRLRAGDPIAESALAPLRARDARILVGHYGAARGRDDWKHCDAMISVGDPRPNLGDVRAVATAIGLANEWRAVYRRTTAAEASQVAGRVRAPWRTAPVVHVHVGTVAPQSWDARAEVVDLPHGPPDVISLQNVSEAVRVHGSKRRAGAAMGVSRKQVTRIERSAEARMEESPYLPTSHQPGHVPLSNTSNAGLVPPCDCAQSFDNSSNQALIDRFGGVRAVSEALGISKSVAYHWRSGARRMPADARALITAMLDALEVRDDGGEAAE